MRITQFRTSTSRGGIILSSRHCVRADCDIQSEFSLAVVDISSLPRHVHIFAQSDIFLSAVVLIDDNKDEELSRRFIQCLADRLKLVRFSKYASEILNLTCKHQSTRVH